MPATLHQFAQINDALAATTKKLQKQAILGEYFRDLPEGDLRLAVRYAAGRAFAATDERTLSVGGAIVWDVTLALLRVDPHAWHDRIVKSGEIGEAIAAAWPAQKPSDGASRGTGFQPVSFAPREPREPGGIPSSPMPGSGTGLRPVFPPSSNRETFFDDSAAGHGLEAHATDTANRVALTLADVAAHFDAIAATGVVERKRALLHALFARCHSGREAAYVAKIIFGDLRTGVQDGVLAAAIAQAFAKPLERVQRCQLLVGDLEEVAVLARRDELEAARFRLFHPIQFMLATPQDSADIAAATIAGRSFWAEDKLDGIRAQVHKSADRIAIYTRTMDRTDESFPDVVAAIARLPGEFLLDGEIVPYRDGVVLPFAHIQKRLGRKRPAARMLRENPAAFIAFDLLYLNGQNLLDSPLQIRREHLLALSVASKPPLPTLAATQVSTPPQIASAFDAARDRRNEGIVLKDAESAYAPGRRGQMWLKLKTHLPTIDCVVTAAEYGHGKRRSVLSDYTFAVWTADPASPAAELVNVGKAYSGVTDAEIAQLTETFLKLSRRQIGRMHLVEPKIVLEIAFDQIQQSARHASGYALRFPRIKRIRWDKLPQDADRLARIAEIYESLANFGKSPAVPKVERVEPTLFD